MWETGCSPEPRLVSSSHDPNDLCALLIRLSLKDDSLASMASRFAISALSFHYLGKRKEATAQYGSAIRALQASIEALDKTKAMQMMAASMLLCIYEV